VSAIVSPIGLPKDGTLSQAKDRYVRQRCQPTRTRRGAFAPGAGGDVIVAGMGMTGGNNAMGMAGALFMRISANDPAADRVHPGSGPWILERREGSVLHRIGIYGSFTEALKAVDEEVGLGNGGPGNYELEFAGKPGLWSRIRAKLRRR
jgi:hypothetical protein